MKFSHFIFLIAILSLFACNEKPERASSVNAKIINTAFFQIVKRDGVPMDSIQKYFAGLDSIKVKEQNLKVKKDLIFASYYRKNSSFELAKVYYQKALENTTLSDSLANYALVGLGSVAKNLGDFSKALNYFQKSISLNEQQNDTIRLSETYAYLAQLYYEKDDYEKAKQNINKVFSLLDQWQSERPYLVSMHTLANIEGQNGNFIKAMELDKKGIKLSEIANNQATKVSFQDNLARCYFYGYSDYKKAIFYFNENLKIDKILNNSNWIADTYINLAEVYTAEKDYTKAKVYLDSAIVLLEKNHQFKNTLKAYTILVKLYKDQKDYKNALIAQETYNRQYKKSINLASEKDFTAFKIIYETEKKEKEIARNEVASKQKNIGLILLASSIIVGLGIFRSYRTKLLHKHQQLSLENKLLQEQANIKIQEQLLETSKDLHDSLGAQLTFINSILDSLKRSPVKLEATIKQKITTLSEFSENSIAELKNALWILNTKEINLEDLRGKILNLIRNASDAKEHLHFEFNFNIDENVQLQSKQVVNIFRVIQEIVNNTIKHTEASLVIIELKQENNLLLLKIEDNGKGFDFEKEKEKSFGLRNIESRMKAICGNMNLVTGLGKGVTYYFQIAL